MSSRRLLAGGIVLAAVTGVVAAPLVLGEPDYTSLPPTASEVETSLRGAKIRLSEAVATAEKHVGGVARSAEMRLDDTPPAYQILAYADGNAHRVTIDPTSGLVTSMAAVPRFAGEPVAGEPESTDSGLKYYEIEIGDGPKPSGPTSNVTVHYTGWFVTGEKFDSSLDRGQPATFRLNQVIKGWTEGVGSMNVGGKRKLIIPYDLAYGENGRPGRIPARATLVFDVELIEVTNE